MISDCDRTRERRTYAADGLYRYCHGARRTVVNDRQEEFYYSYSKIKPVINRSIVTIAGLWTKKNCYGTIFTMFGVYPWPGPKKRSKVEYVRHVGSINYNVNY